VGAGDRMIRLEWAQLEGRRPHALGRNARLPAHGALVKVPVCRVTTENGLVGVGLSRVDIETGYEALGQPITRFFGERGTANRWQALDYPMWDLAAKQEGVPVWQLVRALYSAEAFGSVPPSVNCYDTSFYFEEAVPPRREAEELAERAAASYQDGHRAFKVKVGRGARWMGAAEGMDRDVAVIEAVREAVGPECAVLADANNGYTLNGAKEFLARTADARLGWLEEPFNEDVVLLGALREWISHNHLSVLLADGETAGTDDGYKLASEGVLDVIQCDILRAGFTPWLKLGQALDPLGAASAPHHFGLFLGNYVSGHLAGAVRNLSYIEWDEAAVAGLIAAGYHLDQGRLELTDKPGFGIDIDEEQFARAVMLTGFDLRVTRA
jgi:L-rhamnonate dehydratase